MVLNKPTHVKYFLLSIGTTCNHSQPRMNYLSSSSRPVTHMPRKTFCHAPVRNKFSLPVHSPYQLWSCWTYHCNITYILCPLLVYNVTQFDWQVVPLLAFHTFLVHNFLTLQLQFDWQVVPTIVWFHAYFVNNMFTMQLVWLKGCTILTFHAFSAHNLSAIINHSMHSLH